MNILEIDRLGLELYRSPELAEVIQDALCEQDPPLTWAMFLERGTLERLAECMVYAGNGDPIPDGSAFIHQNHSHWKWRDAIGCPYAAKDRYQGLCAAFKVPPVMVEVYQPNIPGYMTTRWSPPSVDLAKATLREAANYKPSIKWKEPSTLPLHKQQENELEILLGTTPTGYIDVGPADDAIIAAVRASHPQATAYRICIGTGDWTERTL